MLCLPGGPGGGPNLLSTRSSPEGTQRSFSTSISPPSNQPGQRRRPSKPLDAQSMCWSTTPVLEQPGVLPRMALKSNLGQTILVISCSPITSDAPSDRGPASFRSAVRYIVEPRESITHRYVSGPGRSTGSVTTPFPNWPTSSLCVRWHADSPIGISTRFIPGSPTPTSSRGWPDNFSVDGC